jgi:hypothetical protein
MRSLSSHWSEVPVERRTAPIVNNAEVRRL